MSDRREFRDLAPPEEAREVLDQLAVDPEPETVPLEDARDRVLAERVDAALDVPGFDRASVDGYAVRAADTFGADEADPVTLPLAGEVHAGEEPDVTVEEGTLVEISTGAVMPEGADAVVMVEQTTEIGDEIEVRTAVAPGDHVMLAGADIAAGARALGPGTRITPREIGLLSALGVDEVPVRGRPTVGIVSTGDELVRPGPMLIGTVGDSAYVGLPGYPISALTIFRVFVAPVIREAAGREEPATATITGEMAVTERYSEGRHRLMPAGLVEDGDGDLLVYPVDKGSGATTSLVDADGTVFVDANTDYLGEGESVEVTLFSPDVRPPTLLGVGEDDPTLSGLLDDLDRPRYLPVGTVEGLRRLEGDTPDVAVTAGPVEPPEDAVELGGWARDWGLVVAEDSDVSGLADLVDGDVRLVNRDTASGLRRSLDDAVAALAEERGADRIELTDAIAGYELTTKAHESPARKVAAGQADAGLGLRATAEKLGLGYVSLGTQDVRVFANPDRTEKPSVEALAALLDGL